MGFSAPLVGIRFFSRGGFRIFLRQFGNDDRNLHFFFLAKHLYLDGGAERRANEHEQHDRRRVDHPRVDLEEPVVEARDDHDDDHAERGERRLPLEVGPRIEADGRQGLVGGRVHHEEPGDDEHDHGEERMDAHAREHLHEVGKRIPLKENIELLYRILDSGIDGYHFEFFVLSAAPVEIVRSALEGILPADHIYGAEFEYNSVGEIERIGDRLKQHHAIKRIEFVSRDAALKKLRQSTGLSDVIGGLSQNPLPDAFIIYPADGSVAALESLRDELKTWQRFDHVQLDSAWIHKLAALLDFGRMAVAILAALLSFALIAITFNTIRLQILTRRDEIEVTKLIGATDAFIRRPFLYFGLVQGLLGGIAAWLLVAGSLQLLNHQIGTLTQVYASNFSLQHLSLGDSLTLLGFSAYLGWLGAWFSVSQHLWQIEPR